MRADFEIRLLRYVRRHTGEVLASVYLLAMVWVGLVPFDFGPETARPPGHGELFGLPIADLHLPDLLANIALYIPLGVLLRHALRKTGWGPLVSWTGAVFIGGVISYATEFSQLFSPSRVSAISDWLCNSAGTILGASLHGIVMGIVGAGRSAGSALARDWRDRLRRRPSAALAQLVTGVIILAALAPFDITFSPNRIRDSLHDTSLTPFARTARLSTALSPVAPGQQSSESAISRERWQLGLDYACTLAIYALLGVLLQRYLVVHCRMGPLTAAVWTIAAAGILAVSTALAQIFIISRSTDVTGVLFALSGAATGACASAPIVRAWRPGWTGTDNAPPTRRMLTTTLLACLCLYIAARELAPLHTNLAPASIHAQISAIEWLPMHMYQSTRLPIALDDLFSKAGRYFILAVGICLWRRYRRSPRVHQGITATAASVAIIVAAMESMQILIPARNPAVTDVLLAAFATAGGIIAFRIATVYLGLVAEDRADTSERVIFNVEFDPASPAPHERVPRRRRVQSRRK